MDKNWKEMTPDERLAQRLDGYVAMSGFEFASPDAEAAYRERTGNIRAAFEMKEPARVPVFPSEGFFPASHAGLTMKDALYEYERVAQAILAYLDEFNDRRAELQVLLADWIERTGDRFPLPEL